MPSAARFVIVCSAKSRLTIATGSLLGVNGYGDDASSIPVGYETTLTMRPLDFEEFLWANGIPEAAVGMLKNALVSETPVPEPLHGRMHELLLQYAAIGGMPAVVDAFIATHNMSLVLQKQRDLLNSYRGDMTKYAQGVGGRGGFYTNARVKIGHWRHQMHTILAHSYPSVAS